MFTNMCSNIDYFDDCPIACHQLDREGVIVRVNAAECKLLGCSPSSLLGKPVWDFVAPGKQQISRLAVTQKLAGSRPILPFFREYLRSDGAQLTLEVHDRLIHDPEGNITGLCAWVLDRTAQVERQEQLNRQAAWLTAMFDSLPYGLIAADSLHRVNYANTAAARNAGMERQEAMGRDLNEMLSGIFTGEGASGATSGSLSMEEDLLFSADPAYLHPASDGKPEITFYRLEGPKSILGVGVLLR